MQKTLKIGLNKGKRRLWIEGRFLIDCNLPHGAQWRIFTANGDTLWIQTDANGDRRIAGTMTRPIIDIAADRLFESLGWEAGDVVTLRYSASGDGAIIVTKGE